MAKEYKVTVDQSMKAENDPKALEKKMNELGSEGWRLTNVTTVSAGFNADNFVTPTRIYLFWERDAASN